jgi:hypothetical protein
MDVPKAADKGFSWHSATQKLTMVLRLLLLPYTGRSFFKQCFGRS